MHRRGQTKEKPTSLSSLPHRHLRFLPLPLSHTVLSRSGDRFLTSFDTAERFERPSDRSGRHAGPDSELLLLPSVSSGNDVELTSLSSLLSPPTSFPFSLRRELDLLPRRSRTFFRSSVLEFSSRLHAAGFTAPPPFDSPPPSRPSPSTLLVA